MIDIPLPDIIAKIKEQKGLSEAEIRTRIKEKLKQLAGLISEEGAAHIVANELGIELVKTGGEAKIRDLYPGMRSVTVPGRVTRKFEVRQFNKEGRQGKVASFFIADETGQVRVTLWNDQANDYDKFTDGDIVRVKNGYVKENRGFTELHLNADSRLELAPKGVTIGEIKRQQALERPPAERKTIKEMTGAEENVELLATVVQLYDPRYFDVCPQCGKRAIMTADGGQTAARCPEHGIITPQTNYVLSAFLDDGTGNMRATFWRQQAQRLTGKSDSQLLQYKDNPTSFEEVKTELLGEIIKVVGRCKKNETFDRVELTANLVFKDINPEEELARLKEESAANVAKLDAPPEVKERIAKVLGEPKASSKAPGSASSSASSSSKSPSAAKPATKSEIETKFYTTDGDDDDDDDDNPMTDKDEFSGSASEDVISLDDLEDLDEKM